MGKTLVGFYVTGGTLRHDAPCYVERRADKILFDHLEQGEFCYVLTARQMGKSSLMVRTATRLREQNCHVAVLDLAAIGQNVNPEQWYDGMLVRLARQMNLEDELDTFWEQHSSLGPCQRLFTALREVVLPLIPKRWVIFVDEIDIVRSLAITTDEFFAAIRECYNRRTEDPAFNRLSFCLLGVAMPSDLIRDTRITPFNIARCVELHDFTSEETQPLAQGLKAGISDTDHLNEMIHLILNRIYHWTRGHPYLTQRLCQALAEKNSIHEWNKSATTEETIEGVDQCCHDLFFSDRARERDDNLIFVRERLLRSECDLATLLCFYESVVRNKRVKDDGSNTLVNQLRLSGVVRSKNGLLHQRNRIYKRVFDRAWIKANMPDAEKKRQEEAFRKGVLRTAAFATFIVALMTGIVLIALNQAEMARRNLAEAKVSQAKVVSGSGMAGRRLDGLANLKEARADFPDQATLRDQAISCLALTDLEKMPEETLAPTGQVAMSVSDGLKRFATVHAGGEIEVFRTEDRQLVTQLPSIGMPISWIKLSPNGEFVAAQYETTNENRFILWSEKQPRRVLDFTNHIRATALDFSRDNLKVAMGLPEGMIRIHSLPDGKLSRELPLEEITHIKRVPAWVRWDPSGERLAESSDQSFAVRILDLTGRVVKNLLHKGSAVALAWAPDGNQLATATDANTLNLWNLQFEFSRELGKSLSDTILDLAFNPEGNLLASLGADRSLKLWTTATGSQVSLNLEGEASGQLHFNEAGTRLCLVRAVSGIEQWKIHGLREYQVFSPPVQVTGPFSGLGFGPEGRILLAANEVGAFLWDTENGRTLPLLDFKSIRSGMIHPKSGDLLLSTSYGFYGWRRDVTELQDGRLIQFGASDCFALPDGLDRFSFCVAKNEGLVVHDDHLHQFRADDLSTALKLSKTFDIQELSLSPDGQWLATWSEGQKLIKIWKWPSDQESPQPVATMPGSRHFAFTPNSQWLVTCWSREYHFWDTKNWIQQSFSIPRSASGDPDGPLAFASLPQGGAAILAIAAAPTSIELFVVENPAQAPPKLIARLASPDRKISNDLAFSPDGTRLASATIQQVIQVWDLARIRKKLIAYGLENNFPRWPEATPDSGDLALTINHAERDTEKPKHWGKIERLTETMANSKEDDLPEILYERGLVWQQLGRDKQALLDFREASRLRPDKQKFQDQLREMERIDAGIKSQ